MATISVSAAAQPEHVPPRVQVNVTDSGNPAISSVTVVRLNLATGAMATVRTADGNPLPLSASGSTRTAILYDHEAPFGVPVTYYTLEQPGNTSAQLTLAVPRVWLVPPGVPGKGVAVTVATWGERTRQATRGVFYPMGRTSPVVITDGARKSAAGSLQVVTLTDADRRAMNALLDDSSVVLLNVPAANPWGVDTCYVSFGDSVETRVSRIAAEPGRMWTLPYVVVDSPIGGAQSQWTWQNVIDTYATWNDVMAANSTWAQLQTPIT